MPAAAAETFRMSIPLTSVARGTFPGYASPTTNVLAHEPVNTPAR